MVIASSRNITTDVSQAADQIRAGGVIALQTDTVFGVVADATSMAAVAQLYALKLRPASQPMQVLVPSFEMAESIAVFSEHAHRIAEKFWPGPLTIILPKRATSPLANNVCGAAETVGLRHGDAPAANALMQLLGIPLAASSANRAGEPPCLSAQEVLAQLPDISLVVAGNQPMSKQASTVIAVAGEQVTILREGSISEAEIRQTAQGAP